jgi:hypothetical protein
MECDTNLGTKADLVTGQQCSGWNPGSSEIQPGRGRDMSEAGRCRRTLEQEKDVAQLGPHHARRAMEVDVPNELRDMRRG